MKLEADSLKNLYLKARLSFNACILNPDNDFLKGEINFSIHEITPIEEFVRVQFFKHDIDRFVIEVKLQLFSPDQVLIGTYFYYEDEKNMPIDDKLVFD